MKKIQCYVCKKDKAISAFWKDDRYPARLYRGYECKKCYRERRRTKKILIQCLWCDKIFEGTKARKYCSKSCREKYHNKKYYWKYKGNFTSVKKNRRRDASQIVTIKKAENKFKRYSEEEIELILKKDKDGKYVKTAFELAVELKRSFASINLVRHRYKKESK
jgi:hypothetical protein